MNKVEVYKKPVPDFVSPDAPKICGNNPATVLKTSQILATAGAGTERNTSAGKNTIAINAGTYDVQLMVGNTCYDTVKEYITATTPFPRYAIRPVDCNKRTAIVFEDHSLSGILGMELGRQYRHRL